MKDLEIKSAISPIILGGPDYGSVQIKMIPGGLPYLGVEVNDPRLTSSSRWHPINDKDLWRLELAIKKCRKAQKGRKS